MCRLSKTMLIKPLARSAERLAKGAAVIVWFLLLLQKHKYKSLFYGFFKLPISKLKDISFNIWIKNNLSILCFNYKTTTEHKNDGVWKQMTSGCAEALRQCILPQSASSESPSGSKNRERSLPVLERWLVA